MKTIKDRECFTARSFDSQEDRLYMKRRIARAPEWNPLRHLDMSGLRLTRPPGTADSRCVALLATRE